ncbi:MAG: hypothetical protein WBD40_19525 [Tepidisphaeraceae bacterium]
MSIHFEATGNMDAWPENVAGKPTQAAVFGVFHSQRGKACEILWSGKFPDLEPAMYWAAKKEVEAVRKGKWIMASRVLWQHELTPEEAVRVCHKTMEPQVDRALAGMMNGGDIDVGTGPMREVRPGEALGYYVEVVKSGDEEGDPLASFIAPPPTGPMPPIWEDDGDGNDIPVQWLPRDPRER